MPVDYCTDETLAYERSRTRLEPGAGMMLDEAYRLAHLPLVAPDHPGVIASKPGAHYAMGRHPAIYSLVLPIDADALDASPAFRRLEREMRASPLSAKISWPIVEQRRARLHATICGSLGVDAAPSIDAAQRAAIAAVGPVRVQVRGLFSGNVNTGRLYLRAYPEQRDGANVFHRIQQAMGRPTTDLYVVGLWNLTDHLDAREAAALDAILTDWWDVPLLDLEARELWLIGARDDLVLDAEIAERIALTG